jgi:hypothetical protein
VITSGVVRRFGHATFKEGVVAALLRLGEAT